VPLQALRDPALVERAIATSVGSDNCLIAYVGNKRLLVLVDNFEQVVDAAPTVSALLGGTPNAKVLVTSREPLLVDGEHRYPVEPLPDKDAEELFVERACAARPSFQRTPAVGNICARLDGLPLAIELAAARVGLLDPDDLLDRLERRLPLLASRSRDAPTRQRTLRATIAWSYDLLAPEEQVLFRRLAVFRGSFSLDAAEAICLVGLDLIESLALKSLVRRWASGRLGLLDTIREYALELLDASGEADSIRRRHADFFLAVAESANLNTGLPGSPPQRLDIAFLEQDNIRGAMAWAFRSGEVQLGLELGVAMEQFWPLENPEEGIRWFERLLEGADDVSPDLRGHALRSYGSSAGLAGDFALAERLWEESLACFEQLGDEHGRAVLMHRLGISAMMRGDLERAQELVEASDEIHTRNGDVWGRAQTVGTLGALARERGDGRRALELVERSAELAGEAGVRWWRAGMLAELAALHLAAGRVEEGEAFARESLGIADELRDRPGRIFGVGLLALAAAEHGDFRRAGRLWGPIEGQEAHAPLGGWGRHREACDLRIRSLVDEEFDRARGEARELTLDEAVAFALGRDDREGVAATG
jgi:predicted ATPase